MCPNVFITCNADSHRPNAPCHFVHLSPLVLRLGHGKQRGMMQTPITLCCACRMPVWAGLYLAPRSDARWRDSLLYFRRCSHRRENKIRDRSGQTSAGRQDVLPTRFAAASQVTGYVGTIQCSLGILQTCRFGLAVAGCRITGTTGLRIE